MVSRKSSLSLVEEDATVEDALLDGPIRHCPLTIAVELVHLKVSFLDGAIWKRSLTVTLQLVVFKLAFFDKAVGINAGSVSVHLTVAVLAFDEARIRQVNSNAVQLLFFVHFSLSDAVNDRVRINTEHSSDEHRLIIVSWSHAHDLADALHLQVVFEFSAQLLKSFPEVYSVRIHMLEEKVTALCLVKNLVHRPIEKFFN